MESAFDFFFLLLESLFFDFFILLLDFGADSIFCLNKQNFQDTDSAIAFLFRAQKDSPN